MYSILKGLILLHNPTRKCHLNEREKKGNILSPHRCEKQIFFFCRVEERGRANRDSCG